MTFIIILIMTAPLTWGYCLLLKNLECTVRKVIVNNDYMTFPYKIGVDDVLKVVMITISLNLNFVYQILLKILV